MDLQRLSFFCLCFLSVIVSLRAQSECDMIQASDLGSSTPSTVGFIAVHLGGADAASRPMVSVSNIEVISLAVGTVQNMFRWASVFATYDCSGMLCPSGTYPRTEQFEVECVLPSGQSDPIWTDSNLLQEQRNTPVNPSLTSADLRRDCSFCVSPADRDNLGVPATIAIDAEFHCAACDASCLTGNDGLGYCTGTAASACCNVYQPNALGVNICAVSCDMGYEADLPDFICVEMCESLTDPVNGSVNVTTRTLGSVAYYSCEIGYNLTGDSSRTCQAGSSVLEWSGSEPTCPIVDCGSLENPANGLVTVTGTTFDSTATYTCTGANYLLVGVSMRMCQADGFWSDNEPTCEEVCEILSNPVNGQVIFSQERFVGSVATYSCDAEFELVGNETRTCQSGSAWTGTEPSCQPLCPNPVAPANGGVTFTGNSVDDTATYTCDPNFEPVGSTSATCTAAADMNSAEFSPVTPVCRPLCLDPADLTNGMVTFSGNSVDDAVNYTCNSGFELVGNATATCTQVDVNSAAFSPAPPVCMPVDCDSLPALANGVVTMIASTFGSTANYSCIEGYELVGNSQRTCQANGQWNGSEPSCTPVCNIDFCTSCSEPSVCEFCEEGYTLEGGECMQTSTPSAATGDDKGAIIGIIIGSILGGLLLIILISIIIAAVYYYRKRHVTSKYSIAKGGGDQFGGNTMENPVYIAPETLEEVDTIENDEEITVNKGALDFM